MHSSLDEHLYEINYMSKKCWPRFRVRNSTSSCVNWAFWHEWVSSFHSRFKGPRVPKKAQFTQERVEYNVFLLDEPPKGSKSPKIFKISLMFRFDKL
jgi:hypothetical protein